MANPSRLQESDSSQRVRLIVHGPLRLRLLGRLGELQELLNQHSFWARGRSQIELVRMLFGSSQVVTAWDTHHKLIGFARATSDGVFRCVLWDVVVAQPYQGRGVGKRLVTSLLECRSVNNAERIYLMTTNSDGFYQKIGFKSVTSQHLMMKSK